MQFRQEPDLEMLRRGDLVGARQLRLPGLTEFPPDWLTRSSSWISAAAR